LTTYVTQLFPKLSPVEQQISVALYRLLAEGQPVARDVLAAQVHMPPAQVGEVLDNWFGVFYDPAGEIIGYWGLSLKEMRHRFRIRGRALYAWCAWDTLFLPQIIGVAGEVGSTCPVSGDSIRLLVTPYGVEAADPASTVISFVTPRQADIREDVILNFCHHVHFFRSGEAAGSWIAKHPGARLLTLDEGWALGHEKNAVQYDGVRDIHDTSHTQPYVNRICCGGG
jgi:alkylmercury lyase